jgi:hypothetical protein
MILIVPNTARPTRQVRPTMWPLRLRMHEMRCSLDARPVVRGELADARDHAVDVLLGNFGLAEGDFFSGITCFRHAPEVHHDLQELEVIRPAAHSMRDVYREYIDQGVQVVRDI